MDDKWVKSDCLTIEGFPPLLWETLQQLGYTEAPMYYKCEYIEDGVPKCEICVQHFRLGTTLWKRVAGSMSKSSAPGSYRVLSDL
jgi:hypothetical protein